MAGGKTGQPVGKVNDARMFWVPGFSGVRMLRATFTSYAYERHTHGEYVIGAVERGVQRFFHKGGNHYAQPGKVFSINPDEVHAGEAALETGYTYRAVYVGEDVLSDVFADVPGAERPRYFHAPDVTDPELAARLTSALRMLERPEGEVLEAQSRFVLCLRDLFNRYAGADGAARIDGSGRMAAALREYLDANAASGVSLDALAEYAGLSKYYVLRTFKAATGMAPHAYLVQRRVELARRALERGAAPAEAALLAGFTDQSHMTRRFKAIHGITPGAYRRLLNG